MCSLNAPDSIVKCEAGNCQKNSNKIWDDKFGLLEEVKKNKIIEGVGTDAEIITNASGGKQSKAPMALHLVDPEFLKEFAKNKAEELEYLDDGRSVCVDDKNIELYNCYNAICCIADYMSTGLEINLQLAMDYLECEELKQIMNIGKILQYGAERYEPNNWRLIPEEDHINHALIHIIAQIARDKQDDHINHALCRLMMAYSTKKSDGFDYCKYVAKI